MSEPNLTFLDSLIAPRGWLQACEYEEKKLGALKTYYRSVQYVDQSGTILLEQVVSSNAEAKAQMAFFRERYAEMKARRAALRIVTG